MTDYTSYVGFLADFYNSLVATLSQLGVIAALLQVIAYGIYYHKTVKGEVSPNPVTWWMFAYGTALLFVLEMDKDASWEELYLPMACAICAIFIAIGIWKRALVHARKSNPELQWRKFWPEGWSLRHLDDIDAKSLIVDYVITVTYILAWLAVWMHWSEFDEGNRETVALCLLILSNATTIPGFIPILRETWYHPNHEHWMPWAIWTVAYGLLFWVTWSKVGVPYPDSWDIRTWNSAFTSWLGLLSYPLINIFCHGAVAFLALPYRQANHRVEHPGE